MQRIITHHGTFHADDVFGVAICKRWIRRHPELDLDQVEIVRTRDEDLLTEARRDPHSAVLDVGRVCDMERFNFDHHQPEGAGVRPNSRRTPWATAGLVWRRLGPELLARRVQAEGLALSVASLNWAHQAIDERLIEPIDAVDTGHQPGTPGCISQVIAQMNPTWLEGDGDLDAHFARAVARAEAILDETLAQVLATAHARGALEQTPRLYGGRLLALERYLPWRHDVTTREDFEEVLFVIFPTREQTWMLQQVPRQPGSFEARAPLPPSWAGCDAAALARETGVEDAIFCHRAGFIAGAASREGILALARQALDHLAAQPLRRAG